MPSLSMDPAPLDFGQMCHEPSRGSPVIGNETTHFGRQLLIGQPFQRPKTCVSFSHLESTHTTGNFEALAAALCCDRRSKRRANHFDRERQASEALMSRKGDV